jgi:hypothetical protein
MIVDFANFLKVCLDIDMVIDSFPTVYSTLADDKGKEAEKHVYNILKKAEGYEEISKENELSGKTYDHRVFRKADYEEDTNQKFDFSIGIPIKERSGEMNFMYFHINPTISSNPHVLSEKRETERKTGVLNIELPLRILELADKGGLEYVDEVMNTIEQAIKQSLDLE